MPQRSLLLLPLPAAMSSKHELVPASAPPAAKRQKDESKQGSSLARGSQKPSLPAEDPAVACNVDAVAVMGSIVPWVPVTTRCRSSADDDGLDVVVV